MQPVEFECFVFYESLGILDNPVSQFHKKRLSAKRLQIIVYKNKPKTV